MSGKQESDYAKQSDGKVDAPHGNSVVSGPGILEAPKTSAEEPRPHLPNRPLKNPLTCHSEGGVCPRNLLFSSVFAKQIPRFARKDSLSGLFSILQNSVPPTETEH